MRTQPPARCRGLFFIFYNYGVQNKNMNTNKEHRSSDLILGEILVAKIRRSGNGWVVVSPSTVFYQYGHLHVIEHNAYENYDQAVQAGKKLVPESCRAEIKTMPAINLFTK